MENHHKDPPCTRNRNKNTQKRFVGQEKYQITKRLLLDAQSGVHSERYQNVVMCSKLQNYGIYDPFIRHTLTELDTFSFLVP